MSTPSSSSSSASSTHGRAQPSSGSTAAAPHASAAEGKQGLRSRKLSLTTRQLPAAIATAQVSPSSAVASPLLRGDPSPTRAQGPEVGLGLMLDEVTDSARTSIDISATNGRPLPASSSNTSRSGVDDETDEFFLTATASPSIPSFDERTIRRTPSGRLPQLSTVTTTSGSTSAPLQIFTGSPLPPQFSSSPVPSPLPLPRPYSPSHQAYNLGPATSTTTNGSANSSLPMSRPPSYMTSMSAHPMDRSRSNGSDIHSRQQSLTSACPPATSSVGINAGLSTPKSDVGALSPSLGGPRSWRTYNWGVAPEKGMDHGEDVREGAKSRGELGWGSKVLALPSALLSIFLAPINSGSSYPARHPYSPTLNGTSSPSKPMTSGPLPSKRYPLPIRLLTIAYLIFSFLFLSLSLSQSLLPASSSDASASRLAALRAKLGPRGGTGQEGWQLVRNYADGLGAKAGIDLGWGRYKGPEGEVELVTPVGEPEEELEWGPVRRIGHADEPITDLAAKDAKQNPLTPFSHTYRFSKMHEKIHWDLHDEIVPFAFHASSKPAGDDVTACLYTNQAWLSTLPSFVQAWRGPVSLVFEATHSRLDSTARTSFLADISALRESHPLIKQFVDFHVVGAPLSMSERTLNKTRERMIKSPTALNYQLNLARFFSRTDVVFLVGDARITPSGGLRRKLTTSGVRNLVLERGDAIVVPTFGFVRDPTGDPGNNPIPSLAELRVKMGLATDSAAAISNMPAPNTFAGIGADEFEPLAAEYIHALFETLPVQPEDWPTRKQQLVQLVNTRVPSPEAPTTAALALYDRRWDLNRGPTNWYLWRKSSTDPRLLENPSSGGGLGLGLDGAVGGGKEVYRVVDYDLHYAPLVVVSKKGQPWCTERFDDVRAACVYQMYLTGAEMWVLPDEWTYTLEVLEKRPDSDQEDPADKLKNSISSRLYGKFHQEACMHYGREFLSVQMWDSDKAQHLRETCARTLGSWGMGAV
ncbi:hypothetical protein JCM1841_003016 [Sporobolomyces salmonicolor]